MFPGNEKGFSDLDRFVGLVNPDGTVTESNASALDSTGIAREDVVGKKLWETYWVRICEHTKQQIRADVRRAAEGETIRRVLEGRNAERNTIVELSIRPLVDTRGNVTLLLSEIYELTAVDPREDTAPSATRGSSRSGLLVSYSRDADEEVVVAILHAFLVCNIDIFENDSTLQDWINSDTLRAFDCHSECQYTITTRIWGYRVAITTDEIRIYDDRSQ